MYFTRSRSARKKRRSETFKSHKDDSPKLSDSVVTESSGNVFLDIGFSPQEARDLLRRADLMITIRRLIERRKLTQTQAAKLFHVTQPRVSDLMRGRIELFSVDSLITMLDHAGAQIEVRVRAA